MDAIKFRTPEVRKTIAEVFKVAQLNWVGKAPLGPAGSAPHRTSNTNSPPKAYSNNVTPDDRERLRPNVVPSASENGIDPRSSSVAQITPQLRNLFDTKSPSTATLFTIKQLFDAMPLKRKPFKLGDTELIKSFEVHLKSISIKPSTSFEYKTSLPMRSEEVRQNGIPRISMKQSCVIENNTVENCAVEYNVSTVDCDIDPNLNSNIGIDYGVCIDDGICDIMFSSNRGAMRPLLSIQALFPVQTQSQSTFTFCVSRIVRKKHIASPQELTIPMIFPIPETKKTFTLEPYLVMNRIKSSTETAPEDHKVETTLMT